MEIYKLSLALIFILSATLVFPSHSQNLPQDFVNAHNSARSQVSVPYVAWNTDLEKYAKDYAIKRQGDCNLIHSGGDYGENLAKGSGSFTGTAAVNLWVAEKSCYNHTTNTCVGGQCLHYTQVVWKDSIRIGCARVQCLNSWWYVVCSYDPPGNWVGEYPY